MQIKKVAVLTLALALLAGLFAPVAKADSLDPIKDNGFTTLPIRGLSERGLIDLKNRLRKGEPLPIQLITEVHLSGHQTEVTKLAEEILTEKNNYVSYYNAAVLYAMLPGDVETMDPYDRSQINQMVREAGVRLKKVREYVNKAEQLCNNCTLKEKALLYVIRGVAGERLLLMDSAAEFDEGILLYVRARETIIKDFQLAGKMNQGVVPWKFVARIYCYLQYAYSFLERPEDAARCEKEYNRVVERYFAGTDEDVMDAIMIEMGVSLSQTRAIDRRIAREARNASAPTQTKRGKVFNKKKR